MTYQFDKPFADKEGFEPPRYYYHYRDKIACLPIPPPVKVLF